ncbi:hypothetical protein HK101_001285, partial [Irineochytrium annulatum]
SSTARYEDRQHRDRGYDRYDYDDDEEARSIKRSASLPRNVTGPNGQPIRSSLARPKSVNDNHPQQPVRAATKPHAPPMSKSTEDLIAAAGDEMFEYARAAYVAGMADPDEEVDDTTPTAPAPMARAASVSIENLPRRVTTVAANSSALRAGHATRQGSLVRFSEQEETLVIDPTAFGLAARAPSRSAPNSPVPTPRGVPTPGGAGGHYMDRPPSRGSVTPAGQPRQAPKRPPSVAEQRRVVSSLFEEEPLNVVVGRSKKAAALLGISSAPASPGPASPIAPPRRESVANVSAGDRSRRSSPPRTGRRDSSVASRTRSRSRSSSVGDLGMRRRGSTASEASTIRAGGRDKEREREVPKKEEVKESKEKFSIASFFGKNRRASVLDISSAAANANAATSGDEIDTASTEGRRRRRRSRSLSRSSNGSGGSAPNLMASFSLVPSVRVPQTTSLAAMFRRTARDMETDPASPVVAAPVPATVFVPTPVVNTVTTEPVQAPSAVLSPMSPMSPFGAVDPMGRQAGEGVEGGEMTVLSRDVVHEPEDMGEHHRFSHDQPLAPQPAPMANKRVGVILAGSPVPPSSPMSMASDAVAVERGVVTDEEGAPRPSVEESDVGRESLDSDSEAAQDGSVDGSAVGATPSTVGAVDDSDDDETPLAIVGAVPTPTPVPAPVAAPLPAVVTTQQAGKPNLPPPPVHSPPPQARGMSITSLFPRKFGLPSPPQSNPGSPHASPTTTAATGMFRMGRREKQQPAAEIADGAATTNSASVGLQGSSSPLPVSATAAAAMPAAANGGSGKLMKRAMETFGAFRRKVGEKAEDEDEDEEEDEVILEKMEKVVSGRLAEGEQEEGDSDSEDEATREARRLAKGKEKVI